MGGWKVKDPSVIYAIRCIHNGKVYIGRTQNIKRRLREHLLELTNNKGKYSPKEKHFQEDFDEYGEKGFEVYLIEEDVSPVVVHDRESHWIEEYRSTDARYGYNRDPGRVTTGFSHVKRGLPPKVFEEGGIV